MIREYESHHTHNTPKRTEHTWSYLTERTRHRSQRNSPPGLAAPSTAPPATSTSAIAAHQSRGFSCFVGYVATGWELPCEYRVPQCLEIYSPLFFVLRIKATMVRDRPCLTRQRQNCLYYTVLSMHYQSVKRSNRGLGVYLPAPSPAQRTQIDFRGNPNLKIQISNIRYWIFRVVRALLHACDHVRDPEERPYTQL